MINILIALAGAVFGTLVFLFQKSEWTTQHLLNAFIGGSFGVGILVVIIGVVLLLRRWL